MLVAISSCQVGISLRMEMDLESLIVDIKENGQRDPIEVVQIVDFEQLTMRFEIEHGVRRYEAMKILGATKIDVKVVEMQITNRE